MNTKNYMKPFSKEEQEEWMNNYQEELWSLRGVDLNDATMEDLEEVILWSYRKVLAQQRKQHPPDYYFLTDEKLVGPRLADLPLSKEEKSLLFTRKEDLDNRDSGFLRRLGKTKAVVAFSPRVMSVVGTFPGQKVITEHGNLLQTLLGKTPLERYQEALQHMTYQDVPVVIGKVEGEASVKEVFKDREILTLYQDSFGFPFSYGRIHDYVRIQGEKEEKPTGFLEQLSRVCERQIPHRGLFYSIDPKVPKEVYMEEIQREIDFLRGQSALWEPLLTLFLPCYGEEVELLFKEENTLREKCHVFSLPILNSWIEQFFQTSLDGVLKEDDFQEPGCLRRIRRRAL